MSVDCYAVIGWGYIPNEDDEKILRKKFGDISSALEEFEENWEEYPFETCCKDNYLGRFANNYLFGLTFIEADYFDCFSLEDISIDEERKEEIKKSLEKLFEHEVNCNYHIFTHWW
jgi:hypothetical protein